MADKQKQAPDQVEANPPQMHVPPRHGPPPVQQQDLRQVERDTDSRVGQALRQSDRLDSGLNETQVGQARSILDWASKAKGARMGEYDYSQQVDRIADMATRALQTGDASLLQQAQGGAIVLVFGVMAQYKAQQDGSAEAKALSDNLQRGFGMIGTEGGTERVASAVFGAKNLLDNPQVYNAPGNEQARRSLLATVGRLTDPSVQMSASEATSAFQSLQQNFTIASARVSDVAALQSVSAMLQSVMTSEIVGTKMKDQMDKLLGDLAGALAKITDSKKDKDEKEKEMAELEKKAEKLVASALELALTEAGAPPELVAALKGAGKLLESKTAALRERGQQLLQLGVTFLRNKELLLKDKTLLNKLVSTSKMVSAGLLDRKKLTEAINSFQKDLGKALDAIAKAKSDKMKALQGLESSLQGMLKGIEETGSKPLREAAGKLLKSIQDRLKSGEGITAEYLRGAGETLQYLKGSLAALLKLPAKTDKEKQAREESAGLIANAVDSAMKDPKSEAASLLKFIAGEHLMAADPEYRKLLSELSDGLSKGKIGLDEVRSRLSARFLKDAEAAEGILRKVSPELADTFASLFKPLRDGNADLGLLGKASQALGIFGFIRSKVLPKENETLRSGVLSVTGKALTALKADNLNGALKALGFANELVSAPEEQALEALKQYSEALVKMKEQAREDLTYEQSALLESLPSLPKELQGRAEKLLGDIGAALKDFDKAGDVGALIARSREMRRMSEEFQKTDNFELKKNLTELYGIALDKLEGGETEQYRTLMFAASELRANAAFDFEAGSYRRDIMQQVSAMKDPAKAKEACAKLIGVIKQSLEKKLAKAKAPDESTQEILSQIKPGDDLESLSRARAALDVVKSMNDFLGGSAGARLPEERRKGAVAIYNRALSATLAGLDPSISGTQKFLAEKYLLAPDESQRADLESLSARVAKDPDSAMPDVQTFIQINDQSVIAAKMASELPKGSAMAGPLNDISKELDRVRGMIARGEDLSDEKKAEQYLGQVRDMLKDPEFKKQIDLLAAEAKAENPGISDADAMELAIARAAKSAAIVAERERIKGLMALRDLMLKAGKNPKPELAGLFEKGAKAFIAGDSDKGMLFLQAAQAGLANPGELSRIAETAKACDEGKIPPGAGMFILGDISARAEVEKKIGDRGQLANARAYFDLAEVAAANGDMTGAQELRQLALAYSSLASSRESALDKDSKKQRADAMASIEKYLGDYKKDAKRIAEKKPEDVSAPAAVAVLSKKPLKDSMGDSFAKLQEDAASFTKIAFIASHATDFDNLLGKGIDAQWEGESKRFKALADQNRKAGRNAFADYYDSKAAEVDRGFATDAIAKGREMLAKAASELEKAEKLSDQADSLAAQAKAAADAGKADEAGKLSEQAGALYAQAAQARQNSDKLSLAAGSLASDLGTMDESVRKVNTIHRERGRFQLNIAIKTDLAIGLGYDADRLGNRKEGALTPERESALFEQAAGAGKAGKQAVKLQQDIMRTRDAGIAAAKETLQKGNLNKSLELIGKIADLDPQTAQNVKDEAKKIAESEDPEKFDKLQKYYFSLASGTTDVNHPDGIKMVYYEDGEAKTPYDPLANEKKFQQVVGLYWGENFAAAGALSRQAKFDMESGGLIASLNIDEFRLSRQLRLAAPKSDERGLGGFPVNKGGWPYPSELLLRQLIAHLPEAKRQDFYDKLDKMDKGKGGDFGREMMLDALQSNFYTPPGGKSMADKIVDGDLIYFDRDALVQKVVDARGLAAKGDIASAEFALQDAQDVSYTKVGMQEADNERVAFDYAEYEYTRRAYKTKEWYPEEPGLLDDSASGADKKRNLDERIAAGKAKRQLEPAVDELKGGLLGRAKQNGAASRLALKSRDSIERTAGKLTLNEDGMISLLSKIPDTNSPEVKEIKKMLEDAKGAVNDPSYEQKVRALWSHVLTNRPELLFAAVQRAGGTEEFSDDQVVQLLALSSGLVARKNNMEWDTSIEPYVSKRLQTAKVLQNRAAITQDENDKLKLYRLSGESIAMAKSLTRDGYGWMNDSDRVRTMLKNDYEINLEAYNIIFAKSDLDNELQKKWNAEDYAQMKTEMQLWLSGFRKKDDGTLEKFQMTPGEFRRISEAYAQFTNLENDIVMKAGVGVWESDEQHYLARVGTRSRDFHRSAEIIVKNPGGRYLSEVIAESEQVYKQGMPFQEINGKLWDPDYETGKWTRSKQDWQDAANLGKSVLKMAGYGVLFALSPVTGGATGYLAGAIAATEGFIGAAEYYEACGGDFSGMSAGEQAFMIFQVGMAIGAAAAPVVGELAQAQNAARMAQLGLEAESALAPTALELTSTWLGRVMIAGGAVQGGVSIYQLSQAASSGQVSGWYAVAEGILTGIQSGVQPGLHALRGAQVSRTGLPVYRSRALQIGEMLIFGTPPESRAQYRAAWQEGIYKKAVTEGLAQLPKPEQKAFNSYASKRGIGYERQVELLNNYETARKVEPSLDFESFSSLNTRYDNFRIGGGRASFENYAKRDIALETEALNERAKFAKEARFESIGGASPESLMSRAIEMDARADALPASMKGDAVELYRRASAFRTEAGRRKGEILDSASKTLDSYFQKPEITKQYRPGEPTDQIERLAKIARDKQKAGTPLQPHEQAALDFVKYKGKEAPAQKVEPPVNAAPVQPQEAKSPTDIAASIIKGETPQIPEPMKKDVGFELAKQMNLSDAKSLALFARDLYLHESGLKKDDSVAARFDALPKDVQAALRHITGEPGQMPTKDSQKMFRMKAQGKGFEEWVSDTKGGKALVETARGMVIRAMPESTEPRAKAASASPDVEAPRPVLDELHQPKKSQGEEGPVKPVAMADKPPEGTPKQPPANEPQKPAMVQKEGPAAPHEQPRKGEVKQPSPDEDITRREAPGVPPAQEGPSAKELVAISEKVRGLRGQEFTGEMDKLEPAVRRMVEEMLKYEAGSPEVQKLAKEWESAAPAREQAELDRLARRDADGKSLDSAFVALAKGQRNPTLEQIIKTAADARGVPPEQIRNQLMEAYLRGGIEETRAVMGSLGMSNDIPLLTLDGRARAILDAEPPHATIASMAQARGVKPGEFRDALKAAYQRDGVFGVMDEMLGAPPGMATDARLRLSKERRAFFQEHQQLAEFVLSGNLEGNLRSLAGYENAYVADIAHLGGNAGAYMMKLSDGRTIFLKNEDLGPTAFGSRLCGAQGLLDYSAGLHTFKYQTGLSDANGRPVEGTFSLSEDVHGYVGKSLKLRLPDGQSGEYPVKSVAMLDSEILRDPARVSGILANPNDPRYPAVKQFFDMAATPEGRAQLFQAWSAYHEMSRRALVADRAVRNTAVFLVETPDGTKITFQPFDTDWVAGMVQPKPGLPAPPGAEMGFFNRDFAMKSTEFVTMVHTALESRGMAVDKTQLAGEFIRSYRGATLPDPPQVQGAMSKELQNHDGQLFGLLKRDAPVGGIIVEAGRARVYQNTEGRTIADANELEALAKLVMEPGEKRKALQEILDIFRTGFGTTETDVPGMWPEKPQIFIPKPPAQ
ncbi:MAG TPA: hypothetical protein VLD37_04095 [Candidatus Bilamarchaeum sp.]|nr:hypothetical protein [Candidatus Bilamarchaeum sp.]